MLPLRSRLAAMIDKPEVWEAEILAYEAEDRLHPPPDGSIVFVGSSSIRMWSTLAADMAPLRVLGRGFGGAQMDAVLHYAPRIVLRYRPSAVVLCAGENDLEAFRGKQPAEVLRDVAAFDALLAALRPAPELFVLAVKPSPARSGDWPAVETLNRLLGSFCAAGRRRHWVDVASPMFDERGRRRSELFLDDGLHLSAAGYRLWASVLKPRLAATRAAVEASQ